VALGRLLDVSAEPFVYDGQSERLWTVEYSRDGQTVGIEVDLMTWHLTRRWTEAGELGFPMLKSPLARQSREGHVQIGDATAEADGGPVWLYANVEGAQWVAGYQGPNPSSLILTVPHGKVEIPRMSTGTICWDRGAVTVDAVGLTAEPVVVGGETKS